MNTVDKADKIINEYKEMKSGGSDYASPIKDAFETLEQLRNLFNDQQEYVSKLEKHIVNHAINLDDYKVPNWKLKF